MNGQAQASVQIEYLDDIAIICACGDTRSGPTGSFEESVKEVLDRGCRFVVFDLHDIQGLDDQWIADFVAAMKLAVSSDPEARSADVKPRGSEEYESKMLINHILFTYERSYFNRGDAIEGIRNRASGEHSSER